MVDSMPLGLLGGTFDPVHYGHLRLADDVRIALALPQVRLIPAGDPPHRSAPHASAADRLAMLELACAEFSGLAVDPREIDRRGKSYTVLTLEELRSEDSRRSLLWIIGADSVLGLPEWHRWRELFNLAHLVVAERPGVALDAALPAALASEWKARLISDPALLRERPFGAIYRQRVTPQPISASAIRSAIARGPDSIAAVRGLLPDSVLAYIVRHGLYRVHSIT
ncbi:MAG TPA: nicotinate-nucleotide adenylyltransferase [Casimicrobiaceae bacterium]|jgi:nicotinate-nucleotide adenylyltransferase